MSKALAARWLPGPPPRWQELLEGDPNASFAHAAGFVRTLAEVLPGHEARFLGVEENGELQGGMALLVERRGAWSWWRAMPFLLPGAPLARPGRHALVDAACARALDEALRGSRALGGEWVGYRPWGEPLVGALAAVPGETRTFTAFRVDLSRGLEAARARMDRETRRGILRIHERGLRVGPEAAALEEGYALHRAQARAWPGHRPIPLELARRLLALEGCAFLAARQGDTLAAGVLALAARQEAFVWWSGARPETRASHAYAALLWGAAQWAAARGCRSLNLGASAGREPVEVFKLGLGATPFDYPVRWLAPPRPGVVARAYLVAQAWRRRGRHRGRPA